MKKPISVDAASESTDAVKAMLDNNVEYVIVTKAGSPVGIITESDIMRKVCCIGNSCPAFKSEQVMSSPLITVEADTPIGKAAELMDAKNIRRLPLTEKGKIIGIITDKEIMEATLNIFKTIVSL